MQCPTRPVAPNSARAARDSARTCWLLGMLALALVLGSGSCGRREACELEAADVESLAYSLLVRREYREVRSAAGPVRVGLLSPAAQTSGPGGPLPVLEMPAPCEVHLRVPAAREVGLEPEGCELRFAVGVEALDYDELGGRVRFEALLDGELVFEHELEFSQAVPREQRVWTWGSLPATEAADLVLRTTYEGPRETPPRAGFGLLEMVETRRRPRVAATPERPNTILLVVDTLRADRLGSYGNQRPITPRLDALAARGAQFERAFAPSPWTLPSTTSILIQSAPHEVDLFAAGVCYLDDEITTLAELYQQAHCATAAFVTNPMISAARNYDQGFDDYRELPGSSTASEVVDLVEAWLDEHAHERFFLYVHLFDPHAPYTPEADLRAEFADNAPPDYSERAWVMQSGRQLLGGEYDAARLERMRRFNLALYEAEIAGVDRQLGRLFERLEEHGTLDKTLIAFTSDHGEEFLEHGMRGHSKQLYTESLHVPLWITGPGVAGGQHIADPVENRHLAPTLLRLSDLEPRDNLFGPNLLLDEDRRALRDRPRIYSTEIGQWYAPEERRLIGETTILAVERGGDFLMWLPECADSEQRYRLFDLPADPDMQRDLAAERPAQVLALHGLIEQAVSVHAGDEQGMLDFLRGVGYAGYVTPEGQGSPSDERSPDDGG